MTDVTMNFDEFLDSFAPTAEELSAARLAVRGGKGFGPFQLSPANGRDDGWILTFGSGSGATLLIASPQARQGFLEHIERRYCGGDDFESWLGVKQSLGSANEELDG